MKQESITSIADLIAKLKDEYGTYQGPVWFRGQGNARWDLLPGYMRAASTVSESTLLTRFKQSAAMLLTSTPTGAFDWLFLMQHYGVPTRLLDWTESPLVATYFALSETNNPKADAVLWAMKPTELNKNANIEDEHEAFYIPSFDEQELESYSTSSIRANERTKLLPIATIATRNNARIQAQLGVFTIHHRHKISIDKVGDGSHMTKYVIPATARSTFASDLRVLGINKFSVFPELSSVGEILKGAMS